MRLDGISDWILSDHGLSTSISSLRSWSARRSFSGVSVERSITEEPPDWPRLLLAASVLAEVEEYRTQEASLLIAQAAIEYGPTGVECDAGALVLTQLSNMRAVDLAVTRDRIEPKLSKRVGVTESMLTCRRSIESTIVVNESMSLSTNAFQSSLWASLKESQWTSATAPTAAGKTFLVLHWLLSQLDKAAAKLVVFLAPTRALVSEIEKNVIELNNEYRIKDLRISSLPISEYADDSEPTILIFTQERLHLFLNSAVESPNIDHVIVDESQKLGDGNRGVILQDAVERIVRNNSLCNLTFLSPHTANPEILVEDPPVETRRSIVPSVTPTVTQHLMVAAQRYGKTKEWTLSLHHENTSRIFGEFTLQSRPSSASKRIPLVALALGEKTTGTLVYANGPAEAEKVAHLIYDGLSDQERVEGELDSELADLSDFCRKSIHPKFQLVLLVRRGVAFHYGNMPTILRAEIERLFRKGKIRFLVCTSTLIEGVNLACRTIIVRGPKKGRNTYMSPQDFWNLAGRAGRWGSDFHGNIVCVDADRQHVWPSGVPQRAAYKIQRQTDKVLSNLEPLIRYISQRHQIETREIDHNLDAVTSYLMAFYVRNDSCSASPSVKKLSIDAIKTLDDAISHSLTGVDIPERIVSSHPTISAVALQALLNHFRADKGELEYLLPLPPEDDDAVESLKVVFGIINQTLENAFGGDAFCTSCAIITVDWMRGKRIGQIIRAMVNYRLIRTKGDETEFNYAKEIRGTFQRIEEIARFKAPKYISAYLDVLRHHYEQLNRSNDFPSELKFDLFLEFGVNSKTMLSLIGLGLSRTSAIELSEFLINTEMCQSEVLSELSTYSWENLDISNIIKREVRTTLDRHQSINSAVAD